MRIKKWEYFGDGNVENGGFWYNTENLDFGYAEFVEVSEGAGANQFEVVQGLANLPDNPESVNSLLLQADFDFLCDGNQEVIRIWGKGDMAEYPYWEKGSTSCWPLEAFLAETAILHRVGIEIEKSTICYIELPGPSEIHPDPDSWMKVRRGLDLNTWVPNKFLKTKSYRKPGT